MPALPIRRRVACAALVALPAFVASVRAQAMLRPTPSQTEGPYYPVALPADGDANLLRNGALPPPGGEPAWVEGTLTDLQGRPLRGAQVEIWQCDEAGHYHHPGDGGRADPAFQGWGHVRTDAQGQWRFRTLRPAPYPGRTPHIHLKVRDGTRELLTTQLYVEGEPRNQRDFLWRQLAPADRALLTAPYRAGADGLRARYALAVAA